MTLEEKVGQMTQIDFSVISVPEEQNADNPIDQAKLEDAVLKHHVGSILNAPYTPNNKAQPIETWRKMMQTVQAVAAKSRLKIRLFMGLMPYMGQHIHKTQSCFRKPLIWRLLLIPN